jgi:hypothetical protein
MHTSVFQPVKHSVFGPPMWLISGGKARRALGWHTGGRGSPSADLLCGAHNSPKRSKLKLESNFETSKTFQF